MPARTKSRKQLELDAREAMQSRLAYVGTLASGLAHEIRAPLNAIRLNVDLLDEEAASLPDGGRDEFGKRIGFIKKEAKALQDILNEFLAFARPPRMQLIPTDLNDYVEEVIEFLQPQAESLSIEIRLELGDNLYPVPLDRPQFGQVVINLLTNAMDAVGSDGAVTVSTRETERFVELAVSDTGGGVPAGEEERIFEEFYTTKERGTGLGLCIARRIAQEHGGDIVLRNRPGEGATFAVRIPKEKILEFKGER